MRNSLYHGSILRNSKTEIQKLRFTVVCVLPQIVLQTSSIHFCLHLFVFVSIYLNYSLVNKRSTHSSYLPRLLVSNRRIYPRMLDQHIYFPVISGLERLLQCQKQKRSALPLVFRRKKIRIASLGKHEFEGFADVLAFRFQNFRISFSLAFLSCLRISCFGIRCFCIC